MYYREPVLPNRGGCYLLRWVARGITLSMAEQIKVHVADRSAEDTVKHVTVSDMRITASSPRFGCANAFSARLQGAGRRQGAVA